MLTIPIVTKQLGDIKLNVPVTITYDLINGTDSPINIDGLGTTCGCTSGTVLTNPVPANSTTQFSLIFNAASRGTNNKIAWITSQGKKTEFYFSANVV